MKALTRRAGIAPHILLGLVLTDLMVCFADASESEEHQLTDFSFTRLSSDAPGYATYQSHNQLVVANSEGIFVSYLDADPDPSQVPRMNSWILLRSEDGGRSFSPLFRAPGHSAAPTVETDEDNNVYVFAMDAADDRNARGKLVFYRFSAADAFRNPAVVTIPIDEFVDKFTAHYDRSRHVFYVASYLDVPLMTIDKSGHVVRSIQLFSNGPNALLEYPHLTLDGDQLFLGWTTATPRKPWKYYSIHAMTSLDGAVSWRTLEGRGLGLPFASDDTGPIAPIARNAWLASFRALHGTLHLMYDGPDHQMYCRIPATSDQCATVSDPWNSDDAGMHSLDGLLAVDERRGVLYAIGADYRQQTTEGWVPIVALRSSDDGRHWRLHAKSPARFRPYALGGARATSDPFGIVGVFTNVGTAPRPSNEVYFFRLGE